MPWATRALLRPGQVTPLSTNGRSPTDPDQDPHAPADCATVETCDETCDEICNGTCGTCGTCDETPVRTRLFTPAPCAPSVIDPASRPWYVPCLRRGHGTPRPARPPHESQLPHEPYRPRLPHPSRLRPPHRPAHRPRPADGCAAGGNGGRSHAHPFLPGRPHRRSRCLTGHHPGTARAASSRHAWCVPRQRLRWPPRPSSRDWYRCWAPRQRSPSPRHPPPPRHTCRATRRNAIRDAIRDASREAYRDTSPKAPRHRRQTVPGRWTGRRVCRPRCCAAGNRLLPPT